MRLTAIRAELKVDVDLEIRLRTMAVGLLLTLFDPGILAHTVRGLAGGAANRKGELGSKSVSSKLSKFGMPCAGGEARTNALRYAL